MEYTGVTYMMCQAKKNASICYENIILAISVPKHKFFFFMHALIFSLIAPNLSAAFLIRILLRI